MKKLLTIVGWSGIMLIAQTQQQYDYEWIPPDPPAEMHAALCHKDFLRFWRIKTGGERGNWHLYNDEDKFFLKHWKEAVEWTAIEGRLPK